MPGALSTTLGTLVSAGRAKLHTVCVCMCACKGEMLLLARYFFISSTPNTFGANFNRGANFKILTLR